MTRRFVLLVAALLLSSGCASEASGSRYASCIDLGALEPQEAPAPLSLPEGVHVTELVEEAGFIVVSAVADGGVDDVYDPMERRLEEAGLEVVGRDYEGFEAELFFVEEKDAAGVVRIRLGPCPDQVTLSILYDPLETDAGRRAADDARREVGRDATTEPSP